MKDLIQLLIDNRYPFGTWPDPECYGKELGEAMQAKAKGMDSKNFELLVGSGNWCRIISERHLSRNFTYRLRFDYKKEPEIVECEVYESEKGYLHFRESGHNPLLSKAIDRPDFFGFKYADGTVSACARRYQMAQFSAQITVTSDEGSIRDEALTPTHVLFKRSKK